MKPPLALKAGENIIPIGEVKRLDITQIEHGSVSVFTHDGTEYEARGFDAIEAVMVLKPSALEGRRMRWQRHAWAFHNIIAHPVVQILAWLGLKRAAVRFHDYTTPRPRGTR